MTAGARITLEDDVATLVDGETVILVHDSVARNGLENEVISE